LLLVPTVIRSRSEDYLRKLVLLSRLESLKFPGLMVTPFDKPIPVTRPYLPPLEQFCAELETIWENAWLTNNGPVLKRFAEALEQNMGTPNLSLFANGTLALQIALQALQISGEVITTPFTFVATTHALSWNRLQPVFVDIEPDSYTLDPARVEAAITPRTQAILAVHVFGYPCQLDALADIASRYQLPLIYDAAHAFGVEVAGRPIGSFGDLSMFSFHATKLCHSIEGGMLTFAKSKYKEIFHYLKNFGFKNEVEMVMPGTNAKMNELEALMGLQVLERLDQLIEERKRIHHWYVERLANVPGLRLPRSTPPHIRHNYAYFPIEVDAAECGMDRDGLYHWMREHNVLVRRYFYPLIPELACYRHLVRQDELPVSQQVARRILNLPLYNGLTEEEVTRICEMVAAGAARGQSQNQNRNLPQAA
jgi:dTDP-4-amino-4,6-dideoxygalactose transaminase